VAAGPEAGSRVVPASPQGPTAQGGIGTPGAASELSSAAWPASSLPLPLRGVSEPPFEVATTLRHMTTATSGPPSAAMSSHNVELDLVQGTLDAVDKARAGRSSRESWITGAVAMRLAEPDRVMLHWRPPPGERECPSCHEQYTVISSRHEVGSQSVCARCEWIYLCGYRGPCGCQARHALVERRKQLTVEWGMRGAADKILKEVRAGRVPEYLTSVELAKRLGVTLETVQDWRQQGNGPDHIQAGGEGGPIVYCVDDVEHYEQELAALAGDSSRIGPPEDIAALTS
jgi:hypothetical protein